MSFNETFWPIAAKEHRCEWCFEAILKAERHAHFVGKWEGEFQNWRMHEECYADAVKSSEMQDGFTPGDHKRPTVKEPHEQDRR